MFEKVKNKVETFAATNAAYCKLADKDEREETIREIADNDGRCTCTARTKGPECPCYQADKVVKGELEFCLCGLFEGVGE